MERKIWSNVLVVLLSFIIIFLIGPPVFAQSTTNPTSMTISPCYGKVNEPVSVTIDVSAKNPSGRDIYYKYLVNMGRYCMSDGSSDSDQWAMLKNWTTETTFQTEPLTFSQEGKNIFIVLAATAEENPSVLNPSSPDPPDFCSAMIGQYFEVKNVLTGQEEREKEVQIDGSGKIGEPVTITSLPNSENLWYQFWVNTCSYENRNASSNWVLIKPADSSVWTQENSAIWIPESESLYTFVVWSTTDPNLSCKGMAGGSYRATEKESTLWPMYGHDAQHTWLSTLVGPQTNNLEWDYEYQSLITCATLGVDKQGTIYIENIAVDYTGHLKWQWDERRIRIDGPATLSNGKIVFLNGQGFQNLYTIEPRTGDVQQIFDTESGVIEAPGPYPVVGPDGMIYFSKYITAGLSRVFKIDANGREQWRQDFEEAFVSSASVLSEDGSTLFVGGRSKIHALRTSDGALIWTANDFDNSSAIVDQQRGLLYVGKRIRYYWDYCLAALDLETGSLVWEIPFPYLDGIALGPEPERAVYAGRFLPVELAKVDPENGSLVWEKQLGARIPGPYGNFLSPVIGADGLVYYTTIGASGIYAVRPDGTLAWEFKFSDFNTTNPSAMLSPVASPLISIDGQLIVEAIEYPSPPGGYNIGHILCFFSPP